MKLTHFYQSFSSQLMKLEQSNGPGSLRKTEKLLILLDLESGVNRVSGVESHKLKYKFISNTFSFAKYIHFKFSGLIQQKCILTRKRKMKNKRYRN